MSISQKIISSVIAEMIESAQNMGDVIIIPNTYDVYIHKEDFKDVRHFLNVLREQIIKQLDKEVMKRSKSNVPEGNKFASILNKLLGFKALTGGKDYRRVEEHWDINFQESDDKIWIGDEVFELKKGEVCTVRNFSSLGTPNLDSQFGTVVTIYQDNNSVKKSLLDPNEASTFKINPMNMAKGTRSTSYFATLVYKYKNSDETHTYHMVKDRITVGRQTDEEKVDLPLINVSARVSPKHIEIRADEKASKFFLRSVGTFGTTVNGVRVPDAAKDVEKGSSHEIELPNKSRISLAGGEVIIDFSID